MLIPTLKRLKELSLDKRLSSEDRDEAEDLLKTLRNYGFTVNEISIITGGRWGYETVKKYTRGAKVSKSDVREEVLRLFSRLSDEGIGLNDVRDILAIRDAVNRASTTEDELAGLLAYCKSAGVAPRDLKQVKDQIEGSKHSIHMLVKLGDTLTELRENRVTLENILDLSVMSNELGGLKGVFLYFEAYKKLLELSFQLEQKKNLAEGLDLKIEESKAVIKKHEDTLATYGSLTNSGWTPQLLQLVKKSTQDLGGVESVFTAISEYMDMQSLDYALAEKQAILSTIENKIFVAAGTYEATLKLMEKAYESVGRIKGDFEKSQKAVILYQLLIGEEVDAPKGEVFNLLQAVLSSFERYCEDNKNILNNYSGFVMTLGLARNALLEELKADAT